MRKKREKHGLRKTPEYEIWRGIIQRCTNKNRKEYLSYGAIGILMCDEWRNSFVSFYKDMGKRPTRKHSIDRIDNKLGYNKLNCRWATPMEQVMNRRILHECTRGHPWTTESTMYVSRGKDKTRTRRCKICIELTKSKR